MTHGGIDFYDDEEVFARYWQRRQQPDNPNDTLEKPVLWELLGNVQGKRILDLGCGDASAGVALLDQGCQTYVGVEGSSRMAAVAQQSLEGTHGAVVHADLRQWQIPSESFDLVISRLVFHYIPTLDQLFRQVYQSLTGSGRFVFSVEHPLITSTDSLWCGQGVRQAWLVDNYFDTGRREVEWMGSRLVKYHRTVEDYFALLQQTGFMVEQLRESAPQREQFRDEAEYLRRKRIPLFLLLAAGKVHPPVATRHRLKDSFSE